MTITQKQLETAQNIISDYRKKAKDIYDFEVEYIRFLYHPETPEKFYVKVRTKGVTKGDWFDEIDYICVNKIGETENCSSMFEDLKSKMTFYKDFRDVEIDQGKIKILS
tara:strand:- start:2422 stop:2748 length:327 start_codon:yes stop_codon:yes gene_type:complete